MPGFVWKWGKIVEKLKGKSAVTRIRESRPQNGHQKEWRDPELKRREKLPRVTNGFAGSFNP